MSRFDDGLRALSHPARRRILELTLDRERPASELARRVRMSRPATSQHLRTLLEADLVDVRVDGRNRYYRANGRALENLRRELARFWDPRLIRLREDAAARATAS